MSVKPQICVIGLGKFGYKFGITLVQLGYQVIGVDYKAEHIKKAQNLYTQVFMADATQKLALEQIGVADMTHILVSVGDSISASSMITLYLKELELKNIWVKATNEDHAKLLKKIGANEVIIPEHIAAEQLANRIDIPGLIQKLPFDAEMVIREITIEKLSKKTIREIDLTNKFNVQIIGLKRKNEINYKYIPRADDQLFHGDTIIVIGKKKALLRIRP
jgi:trk system potassium uptake protein TrkA